MIKKFGLFIARYIQRMYALPENKSKEKAKDSNGKSMESYVPISIEFNQSITSIRNRTERGSLLFETPRRDLRYGCYR